MLINITGAHDLTLFELDEAANRIREEVDPNANIIVGSTLDTEMEGKMRVSVVATGIDASEDAHEVPVPRRPMSAPLTKTVSVEENRRAPLELTEPMETAAPVAQAAAEVPAGQEPSLFSEFDSQQGAQSDDLIEDVRESADATDGLPPPAYQPQPQQQMQQQQPQQVQQQPVQQQPAVTQAEVFVAPRAPAPGTPSQDAIVRLREAAQRHQGGQQQQQPAAAAPQQQQPQRRAADAQEQRRFGLNSLINRMTGHPQETTQNRPQAAQRVQPSMQNAQPQQAEQPHDEDQERIEIPAFLRRQAN